MRLLTGALLLGMMFAAFADDEVKLKNGDRLSGKVLGLAGGKLAIETPHSGVVKVNWADIVSIKTDAPLKVKLVTGELLEGKVGPGAEGRIKIETVGAAAPVEADFAKVKSINEPPTAWHGNINAAARATDGNTHTKAFLISAEGTRETESDLIMMRALFRYGKTGQTLTERNGYGIGKYAYKFTPDFYGYVSEELLADAFKDLSLGTITSVGVGYDFVKETWISFSAEAGAAYFSNDFKIAPDESHMGARVSGRFRVALPLGFEFKDTFTIYPNFKHSQDFQIRNEATLGTALGGGWNLLGGVISEFDKQPNPGLRRRDDTFFVGLGYTF